MADETSSGEIPYARKLRSRDRGRGKKDGRRRTPALSEVARLRQAGHPITSAYQEVLVGEMFQVADQYYEMFERLSGQRRHAIDAIDAKIGETGEEIERCQAGVVRASAPLTGEELLPRNPDEQRREPATIRLRREVMRERRITRARQALTLQLNELKRLRASRSTALRELEQDLDAFRSKARHLRELYSLRINTYWDGVVHTHPDGRHLAQYLAKPEIPLPAWVVQPGPGLALAITAASDGPAAIDNDRNAP